MPDRVGDQLGGHERRVVRDLGRQTLTRQIGCQTGADLRRTGRHRSDVH